MHRTTNRFWRCFENLPGHVREVAQKNFELLKTNPSHPSLHFKKVGELWSVRAGGGYRALAVKEGADFVWVWIGTHDQYKRMLEQMG